MKRTTLRAAVVAALVATATFTALRATAEQPERNPAAGATAQIVAEAERLEREGRAGEALVRYIAADVLEPGRPAVRAALVRLARTPAPPQSDDAAGAVDAAVVDLSARLSAERTQRERLSRDLADLTRLVSEQNSRLQRTERTLDDDARAEPITDRLEREVKDLARDLDRVERDLRRLESDVRRLRDRVR